jgi:hypothetical protein
MGKAAPFPRVKRPERKVESLTPSRAKIECSYTSSPRAPSRRAQGKLHLHFVFHISLFQSPTNKADNAISKIKTKYVFF